MIRTLIITTVVAAATLNAAAQSNDGGITPQMLKDIAAQSNAATPAQKALSNAIQNNSIDVIAKGSGVRQEVPTKFSVETPKQSIMNQKSSGRCWMFSGLNVLRANFARQNEGKRVEFSQDYLFFYDQLEKANLMLQACIDLAGKPLTDPEVDFLFANPISDGGTFCGIIDLVAKYGLVPKSVVPETFTAESTSAMDKLLKRKLREDGLRLREMVSSKKKASDIKAAKTEMLATIYRMLTMAYGVPPTEFTYTHRDKDGNPVGEAKTYTPLSFAKECGATGLDGNYIMLMNDPRHEYGKVYEIEYDRHTYDGHNWRYLNLPMEDIKALAITALKDGRKMYSSYDAGKYLDRPRGFASMQNYDYESLFQTSFPMTKAQRIETHDSGSTHAMTLTAVNIAADGKADYWKVENSWGSDSGQKGYMVMTDEWFDNFFFRLVIDKEYVPAATQKLYQQKPQMLKYDDALFEDQ